MASEYAAVEACANGYSPRVSDRSGPRRLSDMPTLKGFTRDFPADDVRGANVNDDDVGAPWREYSFPSGSARGVPRLPSPHRTTANLLAVPGSLLIERQCLRGIRDLIVAQRALHDEFESRWFSMVKKDEDLISGETTFGAFSMQWRGSDNVVNLAGSDRTAASNGFQKRSASKEAVCHDQELVIDGHGHLVPSSAKEVVPKTPPEPFKGPSIDPEELETETPIAAEPRKAQHRGGNVAELAVQLERGASCIDEPVVQPRWITMVNSDRFDMAIGGIIVLNTLSMLLNLEFQGYATKKILFDGCDRGSECDLPHTGADAFIAMEHMFTTFFVTEMSLRFFANGPIFFYNLFHVFDCGIVAASVVDLWILGPLGVGGSSGMAVLRVVRLAKLAKVFRMVRVLRAFEPLRILIITIVHSVGALAWSMSLLLVFEVIGSIFLAQLLIPFINDDSKDLEMRQLVWERFGTWSRAMYTTYEITMAPGGFLQYRKIIWNVTPVVALFFMVYGCTVTFAVIRVITALFLRATLSVCDQEEYQEGQRVISERNIFAEKLQASIDEDGSGGIDFHEFKSLIEVKQMKEWISDAGLNDDGAKRLFRSLMDSESHEMSFMQFLESLSQMRGPPRASDLIITSYETRRVLDHTTSLIRTMEEKLGHISILQIETAPLE